MFSLFLLTNDGFSQQSFIMQYDDIFTSQIYQNDQIKIAACADGGYGITWTANSYSTPFIIKTDSNGIVQWYKHYPITAPSLQDVYGFDIMATADSGFFYCSKQQNNMFGGFEKSILYKLNILGNIEHTVETDWGSFGTNSYHVGFNDYNSSSNIFTSGVSEYHYNGTNGSCCYQTAMARFDSQLNVVKAVEFTDSSAAQKRINVVKEVNLNGTLVGYLLLGSLTYSSNTQCILTDTSGNILWSNTFEYREADDVIQKDSSFYILANSNAGSVNRSYIHKIDFFGNTEFFKVFNSTARLELNKIMESGTGTYYISGLFNYQGLIIEIDTSGIILQSLKGIETTYRFASIDPITKAFLFTKNFSTSGTSGFQFLKIYINNPACSFNVFTLSTSDTLVMNYGSIVYSYNYNLPTVTVSHGQISPFYTTIPICGPLALNEMKEDYKLIISPNPASDVINISTNEPGNAKNLIVIYGIAGNEICRFEDQDNQTEINVKDFAKGMYFISRFNDDSKVTGKFIVQ